MKQPPRVLIEDWLPAAAIGVECIRERSTGQQPPDKRLHVWWARRPLTVSRAAVLASVLPADFPREVFEKLLGFWGTSKQLCDAQAQLDWARFVGQKVSNPHGLRAFKNGIPKSHYEVALEAMNSLWGDKVLVMDPMAGGGSIPLEATRIGIQTIASEYNPVACTILEATLDYPMRFGAKLGERTRYWGEVLRKRFNDRVSKYFPQTTFITPYCYILTRTVPCPDTGFHTPLVPDWHLMNPKSGRKIAAEPLLETDSGSWIEATRISSFLSPTLTGNWTMRARDLGQEAGQLRDLPRPTYDNGKGVSLFTGTLIPSDYIKAKAQTGELRSTVYAVALKTPQGLQFISPEQSDLMALAEAEAELQRLRPNWEKANIIPTEAIPDGDKTAEPIARGMTHWADMFSSRQLLCMGTLVEELRILQPEIIALEGTEQADAVTHLLSLALDKFLDYSNSLNTWESSRGIAKHLFQRHDFAFKATFSEMAPCQSGAGFSWVVDSVTSAYDDIANLPRSDSAHPAQILKSSSTNLSEISDHSITAIVVDPPYDDNVQYSELANFFYVWLKRTQGHRRPEWFSTYLCDNTQEAVVNVSRFREKGNATRERGDTAIARAKSRDFYRNLMMDTFRECRRVLRDDGVLTVMFTHKKQEAWEALFTSLIKAGFTITATWPVKTESEHSLHQAKKNAAQSTVILVARKRPPGMGKGYFDIAMKDAIHKKARATAARLESEGLNRVDQLVGSFGPAMEVYSRYDEVVTDTGEPVGVDRAIDEASDAVSAWRIEELSRRGLEGVEAEGQFALLCWDVLGAAEFRFNEAHLLGKAVGMDVDQLIVGGLVQKTGDKIRILSAQDRRRERALEPEEITETLFGPITTSKRRTRASVLKVHPNDPQFRTALDGCHALALNFFEAPTEAAGIGAAKQVILRQQWGKDSPVSQLMEAMLKAAPDAVKFPKKGKNTAANLFPEFRAWHTLLKPLFGLEPPEWKEPLPPLQLFPVGEEVDDDDDSEAEGDEA